MTTKDTTAPQERRTTIFGFLTTSLLVILTSLILSIIVEWVGMVFWWEDEGSLHSLNMVDKEINYINKDFREENVFGYRPIEFVEYAYSTFYDTDNKEGTIASVMNWLNRPDSASDGFFEGIARSSGNTLKEFFLASFYITLVFTIRLSVLVLSLPLFLLVTIVAFIDGLSQRDLRRWTNGRESGLRYHYMKSMITPVFFGIWILYLSIPVSIHPNYIILPMALAYGFIIREAVSWFKKYL